jgi:hypothetical protein
MIEAGLGPCERSGTTGGREAEIQQLVRGQMLADQPFRCRVMSDSMSPILRTGDRILVVPGAVETLSAGDIVQVFYHDRVVTHRLMLSVAQTAYRCLVTKGDRGLEPDHPWPLVSVSGRVVAVDRGDRTLALDSLWHTWVGRMRVLEWRCISGLRISVVRSIVHWCCSLGVGVLARFAWFAVGTRARSG